VLDGSIQSPINSNDYFVNMTVESAFETYVDSHGSIDLLDVVNTYLISTGSIAIHGKINGGNLLYVKASKYSLSGTMQLTATMTQNEDSLPALRSKYLFRTVSQATLIAIHANNSIIVSENSFLLSDYLTMFANNSI